MSSMVRVSPPHVMRTMHNLYRPPVNRRTLCQSPYIVLRRGACTPVTVRRGGGVMYATISEILRLPVIRQGRPRGGAGASGFENRVRWVHVVEVADGAQLLNGGELVLTTGVALPEEDDALVAYIDQLATIGIAGLVIELVRRWTDRLPQAVVAAAERNNLPLITLAEETRYVAVTEAIAAMIS